MNAPVRRRSAPRAAVRALDVLIVLNPMAARSASTDLRGLLTTALAERKLRGRIVETVAGEGARRRMADAIRRARLLGCRRVVAVGGDGTVAMTATHLTRVKGGGSRPSLAIVPMGTANVLARELGIPLAPEAAIALALDGRRTLALDAIRTESGPIFTQVGVGLDAEMILHTSRADQVQKGRLAYIGALASRARIHRSARFELEVDGRLVRARAWQIVVANIGVLGAPPFTWGPGIDPSDGVLDLCIYTSRGVRDLVALLRRLLTGQHRRDGNSQFHRVRERLVIRSRRPALVQGDGEILGRTPMTFEVFPRAVRVCVPKSLAGVAATVGAPSDPVPKAVNGNGTAAAAAAAAEPAETVSHDVVAMVAQHSRTWVLQGWLRHPLTFLGALDAALFLKVNTMALGRRVDRALLLLSRVMHYGEGWAIVAAIMLAMDFRVGLQATLEALPVLWATMLTVNFPLKRLFRRRRPFVAFVEARVVGPRPRDHSFPSGHTAAAFAGALLFGAHAPLFAPLFVLLAAIVGFSRIYLGVHYPSDVLIGALAGSALAGGYLALLRLVWGWFVR